MKKISIALTTYNGARYIKSQLDSIFSQKMNFHELIICDDNSSDGTINILQEYANSDIRVKLHINSSNLGFKKNFEKVIGLCSGDYIALCDQDDIWLPNHLETLYNGIGDNMLACGASEIINAVGINKNIKLHEIKNYNKKNNDNESIFRFISYYQNPFQGASMLLKHDFLKMVLPIPQYVQYHDVWFAINACLFNSFVFIDKPVTLYRLHNENASGTHTQKSVLRTIIGHFIKNDLKNNRKEIFNAIKQSEYIPIDAFGLVQTSLKYFKDRRLTTRIRNLIFELLNYKSIYGRY